MSGKRINLARKGMKTSRMARGDEGFGKKEKGCLGRGGVVAREVN